MQEALAAKSRAAECIIPYTFLSDSDRNQRVFAMSVKHTIAASALLFSLALVFPAAARSLFWVGDNGRIDDGWHSPRSTPEYSTTWACKDYEDLLKFDRLVKDDFEASRKFASRNCVYLADGTEITIENANFLLHSKLCVRPKGYPDCLWIDSIWTSP